MKHEQQTTGNQMALSSWACSTDGSVIKVTTLQEPRDFCVCKYECDWKELAFYDLSEIDNSYKNDYRKFLVWVKDENATVTYELIRNGVATTFSTSHGEIYASGFNSSQPLLQGINIQWYKVANSLGAGNYQVRITLNEFGVDSVIETHTFLVQEYREEAANGTVKIEAINKGYVLNGNNYQGFNTFVNMVRVGGILQNSEPEITEITQPDRNSKEVNIQKKIKRQFTLSIEDLPSDIATQLIGNDILMNWRLSDYNLFNKEKFEDVEVMITSASPRNVQNYTRQFWDLDAKEVIEKNSRKFV